MRLLTALVGALTLATSLVSAFTNPVIYEDFADVDLKRYNSTYYLSTSTMQYSPGAPILRSYDLANWEFIGHSVPELSIYFGNQYTLPSDGVNGYDGGVWASWLLFVPQQGKWFWGGCVKCVYGDEYLDVILNSVSISPLAFMRRMCSPRVHLTLPVPGRNFPQSPDVNTTLDPSKTRTELFMCLSRT